MAKDIRAYFKQTAEISAKLPPDISKSTIDAVQKELSEICSSDKDCSKRGPYIKVSTKDGAVIGGYAARNGIAAAIRHFQQTREFPDLKETSVRGWKDAYCKELSMQ